MPLRMVHVLGALLALAVVLAGTSLAAANPAPVATAAGGGGGGGGGGGNCNDHWPPQSNWGSGWWGNNGGGRSWNGWGDGNGSFGGRAWDQGCGYGSSSAIAHNSAAGKVAQVRVAVDRRNGSKCQHMDSSGRLSRPGSCSRVHWMPAKGTSKWRVDINSRLPQGRYRLSRSAVDAAGNRERPHHLNLRIH
jgi:hypothetical protein